MMNMYCLREGKIIEIGCDHPECRDYHIKKLEQTND